MFKKILVPVNLAEFELSTGIIPYVSHLSKELESSVVFISVLDPNDIELPDDAEIRPQGSAGELPPGTEGIVMGGSTSGRINLPGVEDSSTPPDDGGGPYASQIIENAAFEIKRHLNRLVSRMTEVGIDAECAVSLSDEPADEIVKFAMNNGCDLIAMATHDRNLLSQAIQGSVTNEVARSSPIPILAIASENDDVVPEQSVTISRVIVPLDGSEFSESVLPYIEGLAKSMSLDVILARSLSIGDIYPTSAGVAPLADTGVTSTEMHNIAEEDAIEYLRGIATKLEASGASVSWELLRGAPTPNIADLAEKTSNSMIALASHGRSGFRRWVIGSVAEELLRETGDPVLIIPSAIAEDEDE